MMDEWPGKVQKKVYASPFLSADGRERDAGALAAADDLGVRQHARVTLLDVIVGEARADTVARDTRDVRGLRQHPVVAHGLRGQLAGVLERHFHLGAVRGDGEFLLVELHGVVAADFHLADLVGAEGVAGHGQQGTQGEGSE